MESRKRLTAEKRGRGTGKGAIPAASVLAAFTVTLTGISTDRLSLVVINTLQS